MPSRFMGRLPGSPAARRFLGGASSQENHIVMIRGLALTAFAIGALGIATVAAQSQTRAGGAAESTDKAVSAAEKKRVLEEIAKVGCRADEVEKEGADLFEVDDARCEIGRYDIKLNGRYQITSMTRD